MLVRLLFRGTRFTDLCTATTHPGQGSLDPARRGGFEIETVMSLRAVRAGLRISESRSSKQRVFTGMEASPRSRTTGVCVDDYAGAAR